MTESLPRRTLIAATIAAVPVYGLLSILGPSVLAQDARYSARQWIEHQDAIARALATGQISGPEWQRAVEALSAEVDIAQLSVEVDRAQVRGRDRALPSYPVKQSVRFLDAEGRRRQLRFAAALFRFSSDNVVTPHGHRHMVSSHLVLDGAFRVRTFDRITDEEGALIVRPTGDTEIGVGTVSTMSDDNDNVHWFVPLRDRATTFDVIVSGLDDGQPNFHIDAIDPLNGEARPDGTIRAPIIGFAEAAQRYTADL